MKPLLQLTDVSVSYQPNSWAVSHANVAVEEGEILSIVGGSGSGKSTLLGACIGAFSERDVLVTGHIEFMGRDLTSLTEKQWADVRGRQIAMIFQDTQSSLNPNRRIWPQLWEYVSSHSNISQSQTRQQAETLMKSVRLNDPERVFSSYPFQLSGGMLQRVAIVMSMLLHPKLILADEPTSALDVTVQAQVVAEIRSLTDNYGTSVIFVTHNMGVASYIADRIAVMQSGVLVETGTRDQVILHPQHEYTQRLLASVPEF